MRLMKQECHNPKRSLKWPNLALQLMPLLWENLANQLNSVRASTPYTYSFNTGTTAEPDLATRTERLKAALEAATTAGNQQMIESVKAALENREAKMELPSMESGPQAFLKALNEKK